MPTIIVSGNIGVGKSTISAALATELEATLLPEMVDDFSYLGDFYRDKARWSFHSQNQFIVSKFAQLWGANGLVVQDGSAYESFGVFAAKLADDGHLMPREFRDLKMTYNLLSQVVESPKLVILLRAPIEQMLDRITRRNRPFERQFDRSYLLDLDRRYAKWAETLSKSCPVLTIDTASHDYRQHTSGIRELGKTVRKLIKQADL